VDKPIHVVQELIDVASTFYTDPVATGEQISAILRETFDVNQPQPLPSTTLQMEVHPLPVPKPVPLFQDPLPSTDFAGIFLPLVFSTSCTHFTQSYFCQVNYKFCHAPK
jgi:hypothetical protein